MARMFNPRHPGLILRDDVLQALGLTATEAARQLDVSRVLHGRRRKPLEPLRPSERGMPKPNCTEARFDEPIDFARLGRHVVEGRFDGGSMTSDGGVMLLGPPTASSDSLMRLRAGLPIRAARCIASRRGASFTATTTATAICRCTCSEGNNCCVHTCGPAALMVRSTPKRRCRTSARRAATSSAWWGSSATPRRAGRTSGA